MDNYQIADNFSLLAKLMDIHGENSFKAKSYSIAAFNIEKLPDQLSELPKEKIFQLQGIGDAIGKKILELLETGRIQNLENLLEKTPPGILEMMKIKGIGPKKISIIWKEMGIESIGELLYACHENRLLLFKGFGAKTQNNVAQSIEFFQKQLGNYLYAQVELIAKELSRFFEKLFNTSQVCISGDFVRQEETISELSFIVASSLQNIVAKINTLEDFELIETDVHSVLLKYDGGIKVRLTATDDDHFAETYFYNSGTSEFNDAFRAAFPLDPGKSMDEESIFKKASIQYIEPCLRYSPEVIEKARKSEIPKLIQPADIKAIIHSHSNWSDGANTIEEMSRACISGGFEYLVISDHSKAAFYANGLKEEQLVAQHTLVDELNSQFIKEANGKRAFRIFKSIESDILNDGSLDYSEDVLSTFDLVIASVHSNLKMNEEKAMKRILKAIENPYTTILGHMTGRLLLSRNGYPLDHKKVIDACAANHVVIELNAHPRRLDMRWQWLPYALDKGVLICIDPDAHSTEEFHNTRYGVLAAQKGMLTKECNLSSFSLDEFESYLKRIKVVKGIL